MKRPKLESGALRHSAKGLSLLNRLRRTILKPFDSAAVPVGEGHTSLDLTKAFPLYAPGSSGSYEDRARLTVENINRLFPLLSCFAQSLAGKHTEATDAREFPSSAQDLRAAEELKKCLDKNGSDKADKHNYHHIYGPILKARKNIKAMLEIGLGTNNPGIVSNMGPAGKPGASLRAFRDFLPDAVIYGADVDRSILFEEPRIMTYYVDQTDPKSLETLDQLLPSDLDLIIDDGLHSPYANINTLMFALKKIKKDGWIVIEDITPEAIPVWQIVATLLPDNYASHIFKAATLINIDGIDSLIDCGVALFVVHRLASDPSPNNL